MKRELKIGKTCSGECRGIALQTVPLRRAQTACSSAEQVQKARMTTNHTSAEKCYNSYRSYNGGLVAKNSFDGRQHASADRERQSPQASGQPARVDTQRCERASG